MRKPSLRIVIPARRASKTILDCLSAIQQSVTTQDFEVVVVDAGGNGNLHDLLFDFPLRIIEAGDQNAATARNLGSGSFNGDVLLFIDADVKIDKNTIDLLTIPIINCTADATVGNYSDDFAGMNFAQTYKQLYVAKIYSRRAGYIKNHFWTAIGAVRTSVFSELNGFAEYFSGALGEDTEFGQRLTSSNKRILAVPDAIGKHLKQMNLIKVFLNDLYKGTNAVYLSFSNRCSITDNRHSSMRDVMAVVFAFSLLGCFILPWFFPISIQYAAPASLPLLSTYIITRSDLLSAYLKHGKGFLIKSVLMTFLLDLIRGLCLLFGMFIFVVEKLRPGVYMQRK